MKLQYITGPSQKFTTLQLIQQAVDQGIDWIQLRLKNVNRKEILEIAKAARIITREGGAKLIINDHPDIAKATGADGVHLGQQDMPVQSARKILGKEFIIGGSAHNKTELLSMAQAGCDYIGLGPFRSTNTKEVLDPVLGLEGYKSLLSDSEVIEISKLIPLIAIGGILPQDVPALLDIGVHGVAVSNALNPPLEQKVNIQAFKKALGQ